MLSFKGVGEVCPVSEVRLASSLDLKRNQFFRTLDSWLLSRWQFCCGGCGLCGAGWEISGRDSDSGECGRNRKIDK